MKTVKSPLVIVKGKDNKLGIENLKVVLAFILFISYELSQMIKKFSIQAAVSLAFTIAENLSIISQGKEALKELRDLTPAESQQVVDFIGVKFDLTNDSLELRIEAGLQFIPEGYELLKKNIDYSMRVKSWIKSWGNTDEAKIKELPSKLKIAI